MNILAIGNEFSQDATRYLHQIAESDDRDMTVVNLNAYQCSLSEHYKNNLTDSKAYTLEYNGESTGFKSSIKEALLSRDWDVVVVQQLSSLSFDYESYQPYIDNLVSDIRKYAPKCKIMLHQTWAYEQGSTYLEEVGYKDKFQMSIDIKEAYEQAAEAISADKIIPSGELFTRLAAQGVQVYLEGHRASHGIGRYSLGLLWYACITGKSILKNTYSNICGNVTDTELDVVRQYADDLKDY